MFNYNISFHYLRNKFSLFWAACFRHPASKALTQRAQAELVCTSPHPEVPHGPQGLGTPPKSHPQWLPSIRSSFWAPLAVEVSGTNLAKSFPLGNSQITAFKEEEFFTAEALT